MVKKIIIVFSIISLVTACEEQIPESEPTGIAQLPNEVRYEDMLFGGQPSQKALEALAVEGFRTILSVRDPGEMTWDEKAKVESLGMTYVNIPMAKPVEQIKDEQVTQLDRVLKNAERPITLHCGTGNRAAGLWAVWLVEHQQMASEEALNLAQSVGMTDIKPVVEKRIDK